MTKQTKSIGRTAQIEAIAACILRIKTLKEGSDGERHGFCCTLGLAQIREALEAAYEAGRGSK